MWPSIPRIDRMFPEMGTIIERSYETFLPSKCSYHSMTVSFALCALRPPQMGVDYQTLGFYTLAPLAIAFTIAIDVSTSPQNFRHGKIPSYATA